MNNLLKDCDFKNGFMLFNKGSSIGFLRTFSTDGERVWFMHQNNSRFIMKRDSLVSSSDTEVVYENEGKKVRVYKDENGASVLNFALYCDNEYETVRTKTSDPWVHLMFEQRFDNDIKMTDYNALTLSFEARNDRLINHMTPEEYNRNIMCAQTNIYFILRNVNEQSDDCGSFIWLGVRVFDDRFGIPPRTSMVDSGFEGATDTVIYCPNMKAYLDSSMHDGNWHKITVELKAVVAEALEAAKKHKVFENTTADDLALQNFYISTEVSGNFTHEMSFKNLSVTAE